MGALAHLAARLYGDRLFHLILVLAALALGAYTVLVLGVGNLFNPIVWWQSIALWFVVAVIGHDLILFPLYTLADRLLLLRVRMTRAAAKDRRGETQPASRHIPLTNYLRIPTLAAGLTLLLFLPGIIKQGAPTFRTATGLTQAPYLSRWLLLTAAFYLTGALCYVVRTLLRHRGSASAGPESPPETAQPEPPGDDPQPRLA